MTDVDHAPTLDSLTVPAPPAGPADWNDDGVVILPGYLPDDLMDDYMDEWLQANGYVGVTRTGILDAAHPNGWEDCTPYMRHVALRRLVCHPGLATHLERLIGEPAGVHLNLTGWVTTTRDWHQDGYLNEPSVGDSYAAVWIALGDIHPDSGPFQYVPGSHRWPQVMRAALGPLLDMTDPAWPTHSERILSPLFTAEIEARQAEVVTYLPKRGDVLIWHGRLLHRGSIANVPGTYRPALIAHYSGIHHRPAMPQALWTDGGWIFPIEARTPVR